MSKQHGMLFADRLMPPLLDGLKTQTRRPVKCNIDFIGAGGCNGPERDDPEAWGWANEYGEWFTLVETYWSYSCCPYRVGDLIWARECWATTEQAGNHRVDAWTVYRATDPDWSTMEGWRWRPSIHMPKTACRCWLEITDVRVERIQDISEEDAMAEGVAKLGDSFVFHNSLYEFSRDAFIDSWSSIYPGSWEQNIWVWALTFKRVEAPQ